MPYHALYALRAAALLAAAAASGALATPTVTASTVPTATATASVASLSGKAGTSTAAEPHEATQDFEVRPNAEFQIMRREDNSETQPARSSSGAVTIPLPASSAPSPAPAKAAADLAALEQRSALKILLEEADSASPSESESESTAAAASLEEISDAEFLGIPEDERNYSTCGSRAFVEECYGTRNQFSMTCVERNGANVCLRGLCVCTSPGGCQEPVCSNRDENSGSCNPKPWCTKDRCMETGGRGWECWHPCNSGHETAEFGALSGVVNVLRKEGACHTFQKERPKQDEPPLDAGLVLKYQAFPVLGQMKTSQSGAFRPALPLAAVAALAAAVIWS